MKLQWRWKVDADVCLFAEHGGGGAVGGRRETCVQVRRQGHIHHLHQGNQPKSDLDVMYLIRACCSEVPKWKIGSAPYFTGPTSSQLFHALPENGPQRTNQRRLRKL